MSLKHRMVGALYRGILKPLLFRVDPEVVHDRFSSLGEALEPLAPLVHAALGATHNAPKEVLGVTFKNPIGLSAGFDYDGHLAEIMQAVGFGFNTVGTVTAQPYEGNPLPRLGRLPKSQSLLVNKGFKSEGAVAVAKRLDAKSLGGHTIGISVGSSNIPSVDTMPKAIEDYMKTFEIFRTRSYVSYFELNISCPNTRLADSFSTLTQFENLVRELSRLHLAQPVFVKMPNEITSDKAEALIRAGLPSGIRGYILGNLVKDRTNAAFDAQEIADVAELRGNFSGKPTEKSVHRLLETTRKTFANDVALIGVGGVFTTEDARAMFAAGADLVQLITGMIYRGPQVAGEIVSEL